MANRLASSSSPYLLQHRDNPVHWQPWDAQALAEARALNKPILLSIGYASCHWCHVMAGESFENPRIAAQMNALFVCIKVDREQRPDLDAIYQSAVQAMSGRGGWPLTVFLTPDGEPFYGGTYFPPEDRYGLVGFPRLMQALSDAWQEKPDDIRANTSQLLQAMHTPATGRSETANPVDLGGAAAMWLRQFDRQHGGFGQAPKFPQAPVLELLLVTAIVRQQPDAANAVRQTLQAMADGGIYDHIGGGFHRYSVDERWLVPHFEKMLYDNAMLLRLYARAHADQPNPNYLRVMQGTVAWLEREMHNEDGRFFAAQDADADHKEGVFHTWTVEELQDALTQNDYELFADVYGVSGQGNFEGRNIPHRRRIVTEEDEKRLTGIRQKLYVLRRRRIQPQTDTKLLTDWNALACAALAEAGARSGNPEWIAMAASCATSTLESMVDDRDRVFHCMREGRREPECFADDAANLTDALLILHAASGEAHWLAHAVNIAERLFEDFALDDGSIALTPHDGEPLIHRPVQAHDNVTPSANGMAAHIAVALFALTSESRWRKRAEALFSTFAALLNQSPGAAPCLSLARSAFDAGCPHVEITGGADGPLSQACWSHYFPFLGLRHVAGQNEQAILCAGGQCSLPFTDSEAFVRAAKESVSRAHPGRRRR